MFGCADTDRVQPHPLFHSKTRGEGRALLHLRPHPALEQPSLFASCQRCESSIHLDKLSGCSRYDPESFSLALLPLFLGALSEPLGTQSRALTTHWSYARDATTFPPTSCSAPVPRDSCSTEDHHEKGGWPSCLCVCFSLLCPFFSCFSLLPLCISSALPCQRERAPRFYVPCCRSRHKCRAVFISPFFHSNPLPMCPSTSFETVLVCLCPCPCAS